jgi:hypothetical protein
MLAARMWLHAGVSAALQDAAGAYELPARGMAVSMLAAIDLSCLAARMLSSQEQRQSCRLRSISFHMPVGKTHKRILKVCSVKRVMQGDSWTWLMIRDRTLLLEAWQLLLIRALKSQQVEFCFPYLRAFKKVLVRLDSACCRTSSPLAA